MRIDFNLLKNKKELLIKEAEKYINIQNFSGENNHSYLVRAIANGPQGIERNLSFSFINGCIQSVDDICDFLIPDNEHHQRCDIKLESNIVRFWQNLPKKYKKIRPERGDVVVGHYVNKGQIVMEGFLGIIKSVDANGNLEIIEASVINNYDEEPRHAQFDGIKVRIRAMSTKGKTKLMGIFTPWFG